MHLFEKEFTAAIFDMDGTMFDTERLRMKMLKQASGQLFHEEISDQYLMDCLGLSAVAAEALAKSIYGESYPYKEIRTLADQLEREHIRLHGVPVKSGLYNLLERLKKNDIFIALATSSRREIATEYLIQAKVYRYFNILVCGDDVENGKPHPDIFLKASRELMCPTSSCLIFEDSQNGLLAAAAAGGIPIYIKDMKDPDPKVKAMAFRSYDSMMDFVEDLTRFTPKLPMPQLNEPFPQSEDAVIAGIHGFGAIGGGYFAPIFLHWDGYTRPHKLIGALRNPLTIQMVNALGKYRVRYESQAYFQTIEHVELISTEDEQAMEEMYVSADLMGLALPEGAIPSQARAIARHLLSRMEKNPQKLPLLIAMNKPGAARYVKKHVRTALLNLTDPARTNQVLETVDFVETVVNRMVMPISEDFILSKFQQNLSLLRTSLGNIFEYTQGMEQNLKGFAEGPTGRRKSRQISGTQSSPVSVSEGLSVLHQLSEAINEVTITLFSAEPDMPLYVASGNPTVRRLRQVVAVDDIKTLQEIKNKLSNGPHAAIAWYSLLLGYKTIGQGIGDPRVEGLARQIMQAEIAPTLMKKHPEHQRYMQEFIGSFIKRCRNSFKDKCSRVGRDVLRKLQRGERIIGAIEKAAPYQFSTDGLEFAAACAILCCLKEGLLSDPEQQQVKALYEKEGSIAGVLTYGGEYHKGLYKGLDPVADQALIARIQKHFDTLLTI